MNPRLCQCEPCKLLREAAMGLLGLTLTAPEEAMADFLALPVTEQAHVVRAMSEVIDEGIDFWTRAYTEVHGVPPRDDEPRETREPWQGDA